MKDLTQHSIVCHLFALATPIAAGMLAQLACQLIDLYFVAQLGVAATAGVNAASNFMFLVSSLTQILATGTAAAVACAVGRKDRADANLLFNQSVILGVLVGLAIAVPLYAFSGPYLRYVAADTAIVDNGTTFLAWVLPGYLLLLPWAALVSALRGTGVVRVPMLIYILTVLLNALLAPILIAGWGTQHALGVRGAGLATSVSMAIGIALLAGYSHRSQRYLRLDRRLLRPQWREWHRIVSVGLPIGADFALTFLSTAVVYLAIRDFGAAAQAGFSIGWRVLQPVILLGAAIGFATAPIAGQNFGASNAARVKETFRKAALIGILAMIAATVLVQWQSDVLVAAFATDVTALAVATLFLDRMSWSFVAMGVVHICSSMFQGLGHTLPSLIGSIARFVTFAAPTLWLMLQRDLRIEHVWYLLTASVFLQALVSLWLLRMELRRRLLDVRLVPV